MKIQLQQLTQQLTKNIAPLYLISGDELLLVQEACNDVRRHATTAGYSEREIFYIESGFNWENFLSSINNFSLFGGRALVELHLKSKLTDVGSRILQKYAEQPVSDKVILIISDKLDVAQQKTAWFKAVDASGIVLPIWPIDMTQLPLWINRRLQQAGLTTDSQGIKLLADHTAGNLLAAAQEIEKLRLIYNSGTLTSEQIIAVVTDNTRFSVFNLLDIALAGEISLVNGILENLKNEGIEPTIILWVIARELRLLVEMSFAMQQGIAIDQAMMQNNVWNNRKVIIKKTLLRHSLASLQNLLKHAAQIDGIIKGIDSQHLLWHELDKIFFNFAS